MKAWPGRALAGTIMAATLLLSGFLLATAFAPAFLSGVAVGGRSQQGNGYGYLLVTVSMVDLVAGLNPFCLSRTLGFP